MLHGTSSMLSEGQTKVSFKGEFEDEDPIYDFAESQYGNNVIQHLEIEPVNGCDISEEV